LKLTLFIVATLQLHGSLLDFFLQPGYNLRRNHPHRATTIKQSLDFPRPYLSTAHHQTGPALNIKEERVVTHKQNLKIIRNY
jgi:hypothetical protein